MAGTAELDSANAAQVTQLAKAVLVRPASRPKTLDAFMR